MKQLLMICTLTSLISLTAPAAATPTHTLCQQLLIQYGRMNAPRLPPDLQFHAWSPGSPLPQNQKSLGALEFSWSQPGSIAVESIAGLHESHFLRQRAVGRILAMTTFAGFVGEEEFKEVIEEQPIPESVKDTLTAPGIVHLVKRLPERYLLFHSEISPEHLRQSFSVTALRKLHRTFENLESLLRRQKLTIESPKLAVTDDGSALLLNFEAIRERSEGEVELYLWREKNIVTAAIGH